MTGTGRDVGPISELERIVVVRALPGLGDLLVSVPAFRALRAALPGAHITLLGLPEARSFVDRFGHYIDELLLFPGFPGLPEQPVRIAEFPAFLAAVHARNFDLALQMHGDGRTSNLLTVFLGARFTAGTYRPDPVTYCPDEATFIPYPEGESETWRSLRVLEHLGIPLQGDDLEFPLRDEDWSALHALPEAGALATAPYAVVHPGASHVSRRWLPERFAAAADRLVERGLQVVLTGVAGEAPVTRAVASGMQAQPIDLTGRTSLGAMAALLSGARLLLCNDTGVSHLAAALGTPSVVIFLASERARWAPLDGRRHRAVGAGALRDLPIAACDAGVRAPSAVPLDEVLQGIEDVLREERVR